MTEEKRPNAYNWLPSVVRNAALSGGTVMAFVGLWWERPSAALFVVGAALAAVGAWSTRQAVLITTNQAETDDR